MHGPSISTPWIRGRWTWNGSPACTQSDPSTTTIFCLCSLDTRIATYAVDLFLAGHGSHLIFSGGCGILTQDRFSEPEAVIFADIARKRGVPRSQIVVEPDSTNTGENVRFTYALLQELGLEFDNLILVQKPYMERRTCATFRKQWLDSSTDICVSSPLLTYDEYYNVQNPKDLVTSIMVGDLVRVKEYPKRGFQIEQDMPNEVWEAGQRLIKVGFTDHLP